ncbi:MAG: ATP-binding protein [Promethearchaeota archaeon]
MNEEIQIFLEESLDLLNNLEQRLSSLNNNINDKENIEECLRILHTLKGSAAIMGFNNLKTIFHILEGKLEIIKNNRKKSIFKQFYSLSLLALDEIFSYFNQIKENQELNNDSLIEVINKLEALKIETNKSKENEEQKVQETIKSFYDEIAILDINDIGKEKGANYYYIWIQLEEQTILKSTRAYSIIKRLSGKNNKIGKLVVSTPKLEDIIQGKFNMEFSCIIESKYGIKEIEKVISTFLDVKEKKLNKMSLEKVIKHIKEIYGLASSNSTKGVKKKRSTLIEDLIRINIKDLNEIINITGELSVKFNAIMQFINQIPNLSEQFLQITSNIDYFIWKLQNLTLNLKLIPISVILRRIPRMVQGFAAEERKKVNLQLNQADEIKIDRELVEPLHEILLQLIKNALSHGIETPEERISKNKPPEGNIIIDFSIKKNNLKVIISDDGRGIKLDNVINIALKKGVITQNDLGKMSKNEKYNLIFLPGFSTSDTINAISGRGIGLSLVKKRIEDLGGEIQVESVPETGTIFSIYLPMTYSTIKTLNVKIKNQFYSIPLNEIYHINIINANMILNEKGREYVHFNNQKWKLIRIENNQNNYNEASNTKIVGNRNDLTEDLHPHSQSQMMEKIKVCYLERLNKRFCLVVDEFVNQGEVTIRSIKNNINLHKFTRGTILSDGSISLVVGISELETF